MGLWAEDGPRTAAKTTRPRTARAHGLLEAVITSISTLWGHDFALFKCENANISIYFCSTLWGSASSGPSSTGFALGAELISYQLRREAY